MYFFNGNLSVQNTVYMLFFGYGWKLLLTEPATASQPRQNQGNELILMGMCMLELDPAY